MKRKFQLPKKHFSIFAILVGFFLLICGFVTIQDVEINTLPVVSPTTLLIIKTSESTPSPVRHLTPIPTWSPNPLTPTPLTISLDSNHWEKILIPFDSEYSGIYQIIQSKNGDIWVRGTFNIFQYHLKKWYQYIPQNIPEIRGKSVESIADGSDGSIWFGTAQNEILSFNGKSWTSETVRPGGYRENVIDSLVFRNTGELCAISIEGLSCRENNKSWTHYDFVPEKERIAVQDVVLSPSGDIWITLSNGLLYHFDGKNWENFKIDNWLGPIASSSDGDLWIYSKGKIGKRSIDGKLKFSDVYPFLYYYPPIEMFESNDGTLWLGCTGDRGYGILRFLKNGIIKTVDGRKLSINDFDPSPEIRYPFGDVYSIFQDKDGYIWFGTLNGLFRYHDTLPK